jgi:hypothetical protein
MSNAEVFPEPVTITSPVCDPTPKPAAFTRTVRSGTLAVGDRRKSVAAAIGDYVHRDWPGKQTRSHSYRSIDRDRREEYPSNDRLRQWRRRYCHATGITAGTMSVRNAVATDAIVTVPR